MLCSIEIETAVEGRFPGEVRECGVTATWRIRQAVNNGPWSAAMYRCDEHVGGTVEFIMGEPTTTGVIAHRDEAAS